MQVLDGGSIQSDSALECHVRSVSAQSGLGAQSGPYAVAPSVGDAVSNMSGRGLTR